MTIREQIINILEQDAPDETAINLHSYYQELKNCIRLSIPCDEEGFDNWFRGVIRSLFYEPNKFLLVLDCKEDINNFFENLLWDKRWYSDFRIRDMRFYDYLIRNSDFEYTKHQDVVERDNFTVLPQSEQLTDPLTDKRLCSYCSTTIHWNYPQRKRVIVLHLESIDQEKFNAIPKLELWREIFYLFK